MSTPPHSDETPRVIGPLGAFSIVAGSMIGVGIFIFSDDVARGVGTTPLFFAMLLLGGFFAWAGSVACGELGAMMPKAGGDYVFQRAAYGPSLAFASGWVLFAAIFAGSVATLSIAVCQFELGPLFGYDIGQMVEPVWGPFNLAQLGAVAIIVVFTILNELGTALSATTQTILTISPIVVLILLGLYVLIGRPELAVVPSGAELATLPTELTLAGLASAFLAVNFIFSGWINIIYVASEVKEPGRNIPRSMLSATAVVTLMYLILGAGFIAVLGIAGVASEGSPTLGFDAGTRVANALGFPGVAPAVLVIITVAILTSVNATILASARVGYAMAQSGAFWAPMGVLSGPRKTPRRALWFGAFLAVVIVLTGTADAIAEMTSLAMFITGALTVGAMYVLRRKMPDISRPYRANRVLPAIYILLAVCAIGAKLWQALGTQAEHTLATWYPLIGVGVLAVAWVGHLAVSRRLRAAAGVALLFTLLGYGWGTASRPATGELSVRLPEAAAGVETGAR